MPTSSSHGGRTALFRPLRGRLRRVLGSLVFASGILILAGDVASLLQDLGGPFSSAVVRHSVRRP